MFSSVGCFSVRISRWSEVFSMPGYWLRKSEVTTHQPVKSLTSYGQLFIITTLVRSWYRFQLTCSGMTSLRMKPSESVGSMLSYRPRTSTLAARWPAFMVMVFERRA